MPQRLQCQIGLKHSSYQHDEGVKRPKNDVSNRVEHILLTSIMRGVKSRVGHLFFSKECNVLAFFYVLYKRTRHSLHIFTFFIKEHGILCVLLGSL